MGWSPVALGSSLLAWWDAEVSSSLTTSGGNVVTWADLVGGYAPTQAVGGSRPAYSASGFNGRPVVTFDGVDDELTLTGVPSGIPTGATPCEMWGLVDQTALAADTTGRYVVCYGNGITTGARSLQRVVVSGQNRPRIGAGDGVAAPNSTLAADLSGRKLIRGIANGTDIVVEMDGTRSTPTASVPATATSRLRIGAGASTSAANFFQGGMSALIITAPLSDAQAANLKTFLSRRL